MRVRVALLVVILMQLSLLGDRLSVFAARFVNEGSWKIHFGNPHHPIVPFFIKHLPKFELGLIVNCSHPSKEPNSQLGDCPNRTPKNETTYSLSPGQKASVSQLKSLPEMMFAARENTTFTIMMLDILHWKNGTTPDGKTVPVFHQFYEHMNVVLDYDLKSGRVRIKTGDEVIKYKFPPTKGETQYVVMALAFAQKRMKTDAEIQEIKKSLEVYADPDNEGVFLVPAKWRNFAPYAGTFIIVNNQTTPESVIDKNVYKSIRNLDTEKTDEELDSTSKNDGLNGNSRLVNFYPSPKSHKNLAGYFVSPKACGNPEIEGSHVRDCDVAIQWYTDIDEDGKERIRFIARRKGVEKFSLLFSYSGDVTTAKAASHFITCEAEKDNDSRSQIHRGYYNLRRHHVWEAFTDTEGRCNYEDGGAKMQFEQKLELSDGEKKGISFDHRHGIFIFYAAGRMEPSVTKNHLKRIPEPIKFYRFFEDDVHLKAEGTSLLPSPHFPYGAGSHIVINEAPGSITNIQIINSTVSKVIRDGQKNGTVGIQPSNGTPKVDGTVEIQPSNENNIIGGRFDISINTKESNEGVYSDYSNTGPDKLIGQINTEEYKSDESSGDYYGSSNSDTGPDKSKEEGIGDSNANSKVDSKSEEKIKDDVDSKSEEKIKDDVDSKSEEKFEDEYESMEY